ncbi:MULTISPECIES: hypothetical protein [unclassified Wolbachia]|nr:MULTISPECIES: hypothetical protein [unclassified Wolbachia]
MTYNFSSYPRMDSCTPVRTACITIRVKLRKSVSKVDRVKENNKV